MNDHESVVREVYRAGRLAAHLTTAHCLEHDNATVATEIARLATTETSRFAGHVVFVLLHAMEVIFQGVTGPNSDELKREFVAQMFLEYVTLDDLPPLESA